MNNDNRLAALASFVRIGTIAADVGTDHGKLALLLIRKGIAAHVYATDINEMPLEKAKKAIAMAGLTEFITPVLTDGLTGLSHLPIRDIVIAGMGGELIAGIIGQSDFGRVGIRFILQPMSRSEILRRFLSENGFFFVDEILVKDNHRVYPILTVEFDGNARTLSPAEELLGPCLLQKRETISALFAPYAQSKINNLKKIVEGKESVGIECQAEKMLLRELAPILSELSVGDFSL